MMDNLDELILTKIEDGVQTVTLNRPEKKNAIFRMVGKYFIVY